LACLSLGILFFFVGAFAISQEFPAGNLVALLVWIGAAAFGYLWYLFIELFHCLLVALFDAADIAADIGSRLRDTDQR
jgi:hypothetical protein